MTCNKSLPFNLWNSFSHFQAYNSRILPFSRLEFPLLPVTKLILIIGPIQRKLQNHGSLFFLFCCFGSYFNCGLAGFHNPFGGRVWGGGAIWFSKNSFFNKCAPWCMRQRTMPNFATSDGGVLRLRVAGLLLEPLNVGAKSNFISYNL